MNTVARDLDNYYSLGYRQESTAKKERKVDVRVKNHPDYRVRSRRTYEARTVDEQQSDRVIANIYRESKGELAGRFTVFIAVGDDNGAMSIAVVDQVSNSSGFARARVVVH